MYVKVEITDKLSAHSQEIIRTLTSLMGGHVRVAIEDSIYCSYPKKN